MKKRIICMILSLVAVFSFFGFKATQTWFSAGENKIQSLSAGDLNFTISDLPAPEKVLPGDTIDMSGVTITNTSNFETKVRVKFSLVDPNGNEITNGVTAEGEGWSLNDGYYEYSGIILAEENMPFVSLIHLNGDVIGNEFNGEIVDGETVNKVAYVKITFEAIQAYYNANGWASIGSVTV